MPLTPIDLTSKRFERKMRGYDPNEVDDFLKEVSAELVRSLEENARLQDKLEGLEDDIKRYRDLEVTLNSTLVLAQKTAEDLRANAQKEAELIALESREKLQRELLDAKRELEELRRAKERFALEFRSMLRGYLDSCEGDTNGG